MTDVITNIFKNETLTSPDKNISTPFKDPETKCGEIILLANANFWFACDFCQERYTNIFTLLNHIKDNHLPGIKVESVQHTQTRTDPEEDDENIAIDFPEEAASQSSDEDESIVSNLEIVAEPEIKPETEPNQTPSGEQECKEIEEVLTSEINVPRTRGRKKILYEPLIPISEKDRSGSLSSEKKNDEDTPNESTSIHIKNKEKKVPPSEEKKTKKKYYRKKNVFPCPICKETVTDGRSLKKHIRSHNEGGNENRFQCEECGKCYKNSFNLKTHSIIHSGTRPFKCEFCDVGFSHPNSLKTHRFLHTGERPYKCDQCDKSFVSNSSRKVHMRTHTGETPFVCQYCGKGYTIKSNFDIHVRRHTGHRTFQCPQCNKGFFNKETLVNHIACHTGEKNFVCDVCSNRFSRRKDLVEHRKLHLDHKYYSCKVCGKEFSQYSGLYSHMRQHKNKDKEQ